MSNLNKGRFKCADEAQAVWSAFCKAYPEYVYGFWLDSEFTVSRFNDFANILHKARLIRGSIYDEHGRIENKDVAYEEYEAALCDTNIFSTTPICEWGDDPRIYNNFIFSGQNSAAVGTIFY